MAKTSGIKSVGEPNVPKVQEWNDIAGSSITTNWSRTRARGLEADVHRSRRHATQKIEVGKR